MVIKGRQLANSEDLIFILDRLLLDAVVMIDAAKEGRILFSSLTPRFRRREDLGTPIDVRDISHGES